MECAFITHVEGAQLSDTKFVVRRSNDDPLEDVWEWVLVVGAEQVALSWTDFAGPLDAAIGAMRVAGALLDGPFSVQIPISESKGKS